MTKMDDFVRKMNMYNPHKEVFGVKHAGKNDSKSYDIIVEKLGPLSMRDELVKMGRTRLNNIKAWSK